MRWVSRVTNKTDDPGGVFADRARAAFWQIARLLLRRSLDLIHLPRPTHGPSLVPLATEVVKHIVADQMWRLHPIVPRRGYCQWNQCLPCSDILPLAEAIGVLILVCTVLGCQHEPFGQCLSPNALVQRSGLRRCGVRPL